MHEGSRRGLADSPHHAAFLRVDLCEQRDRIYRIATWLGDDVRLVQRHYAKLRPDDREIMRAFKV